MPELTLRAPELDDVDAVAAVINADSRRLRGRDDVDADAVRVWWTQPAPFDLEADVVLAIRDDAVVGYGDLGDQANDGMVLWLDIRGNHRAEVHAELERRALERRAASGVVRAVADEKDVAYQALLEERGYRSIRASYRMGIELQNREFSASWPEGATVRDTVDGADDRLLHELLQAGFADHWGFTPTPFEEWVHWLRAPGIYDPSLCFVSEVDGVPAGATVGRPHHPGEHERGWISELAVLPAYRGRGLGAALLTHTFAEFQRRGLARAGLGVDAENTTGAVRLYERVGMRVVERQDVWERQE